MSTSYDVSQYTITIDHQPANNEWEAEIENEDSFYTAPTVQELLAKVAADIAEWEQA